MYYIESNQVIVIDYSQTIISNLMAEIGNRNDVPIEVDLLRHMVINSLRGYKNKFGREYGELVIACDSKKYWRKEVFPYYKANRKKARESSGFDWPLIFDTINLLKEEIRLFFPYKVIEVEGAEADDIIATLADYSQHNNLVQDGLLEAPGPFLIISGDHDFIQLQKYQNVAQFSPVQKKFIRPDLTPQKYTIEHIIKGDRGDGIPNVLSSDECIASGERQKKIMQKKLEEWVRDSSTMPQDELFKRNYDRNKTLIDFSNIPSSLKENIINTFEACTTTGRDKILNYFITNRMKMMIEHIEEF